MNLKSLFLFFVITGMFLHVAFANSLSGIVFDFYEANIKKSVLNEDVFLLLKENNFKTKGLSEKSLVKMNDEWVHSIGNDDFANYRRLASNQLSLIAGRIKQHLNGAAFNVAFINDKGMTVAVSDILNRFYFGEEVHMMKKMGEDFWIQDVTYNKDSREFETIAYFTMKDSEKILGYLRVSFDSEELDSLHYNHHEREGILHE